MKKFVTLIITFIFSAALLSGILACGGSDDGASNPGTATENNTANTNKDDSENNLMFQQEKISLLKLSVNTLTSHKYDYKVLETNS